VERDAYVCRYCGSVTYGEETIVDLIVPVCEGASASDDACYAVFCGGCHAEKKHREHERWSGSSKTAPP
jgi:5-methylcytosine-specific restriction endonuclease McrA